MSISQPRPSVMIAESNSNFEEYENYDELFFIKNGFKISFHNYIDGLPIIIDRLKILFGLESMRRKVVVFPSQMKYYIEEHRGFERFIELKEINNYKVFKIRVFRWVVGLPHLHPRSDIIVRIDRGSKTFISYKEEKIDFDRTLNIEQESDEYNISDCIKEMTHGCTSDSLKRDISKIIEEVDQKYIFLADFIVRRLNLYGYL